MRKEALLTLLYTALLCTALGIGSPTPWTGLAGLGIFLLSMSLGVLVFPRSFPTRLRPLSPRGIASMRLWVLTFAMGLFLLCLGWTASAYIFHNLNGGHVFAILLAPFGLWRLFRWRQHYIGLFATPHISTFFLGLWVFAFLIFGLNEIWFDDTSLMFTTYTDIDMHIRWGRIIGYAGLPRLEETGPTLQSFALLYHNGTPTILEGFHQLGGLFPYQSARILGVFATTLIATSALCLLGPSPLSPMIRFFCASTPLIFSGLGMIFYINQFGFTILTPPIIRNLSIFAHFSAGAYYNLTQLLGIAISFAALVGFQIAFSAHHAISPTLLASPPLPTTNAPLKRPPPALFPLLLGALLAGFVAQLKISIAILLYPALLLVFLLFLQPLRAWLILALGVGFGLFWLYLPLLLVELPQGVPWALQWGELLKGATYTRLLINVGLLLPMMLVQWVLLLRRTLRKQPAEWVDIASISLCGGIIFWLLFREVDRESHRNHIWPLMAAVTFFAPWVAHQLYLWLRQPFRYRWLLRIPIAVGIGLLWLHVFNGALFAMRYPALHVKLIDQAQVQVLREVDKLLPPRARIWVGPSFQLFHRAYLRQRTYFQGPSFHPLSQKEFQQWKNVLRGYGISLQEAAALLQSRDAILIDRSVRNVVPILKRYKWRKKALSHKAYSLWYPPSPSTSPKGPTTKRR